MSIFLDIHELIFLRIALSKWKHFFIIRCNMWLWFQLHCFIALNLCHFLLVFCFHPRFLPFPSTSFSHYNACFTYISDDTCYTNITLSTDSYITCLYSTLSKEPLFSTTPMSGIWKSVCLIYTTLHYTFSGLLHLGLRTTLSQIGTWSHEAC